MSIIYPSSLVAGVMNIALKNVTGTTTTTDGASADGLICAEDLSNLVECGAVVSSSLSPTNLYNTFTKMLEHVGKTYFEILSSSAVREHFELRVSSDEYGVLKQKVRIDHTTFEASYVMDGSSSSSFNDLFGKHPFTFNVKIWSNRGFYRTKPFTISYEMLRTSVLSTDGIRELVAQMWATIDAVVDLALKQSPKFLVYQQIANAALTRSGVRVVNLPTLYYAETGNSFTSANDPKFATWFTQWQRHVREIMFEPTNNYSGSASIVMNTPDEYRRSFLYDRFYDAINAGLSGIYHDDKIGNIDDYELIPFLQNVNEPTKLSINPQNPDGSGTPISITSGKHVTNVTFGNVVGMIWDKRGTFYSVEYRKIGQQPNEFDDHVNYISTVGVQHCVDADSNMIVFTLNSSSSTDYVITEESDT